MIKIYNEKTRKLLKKSLIAISIILFIFIIALLVLKYEVEGENIETMPFKIESITIASKIDGIENKDEQNAWNINIQEINDIYIKIEKNGKQESDIKNIRIQDIEKHAEKTGQITRIKQQEQYENLEKIEYEVGKNTNIEELSLAKEGGIIGFRYIIDDLGTYKSNEEEITYNQALLEKIGINKEAVSTELTFNLIVELEDGISYISNIKLQLPTKEANVEKADLNGIIFKRLLQK